MNWLRTLTFALALAVPVAAAAQSWESVTVAYDLAEDEVGTLTSQRDAAFVQLQTLSAQVDALKDGDLSNPLNARELQGLLRDGQRLAEQLQAMETDLSERVQWRDQLRDEVQAAVRYEMATLEQALPTQDANARVTSVIRLNELSGVLSEYEVTPVAFEAVPINAILSGLIETPEELYATADELTDNHARLQRQLDELNARIASDDAERRLLQRSRELAYEETFFEEAQGATIDRNSGTGGAVAERQADEPTQDSGDVLNNSDDDSPVVVGVGGGPTDDADFDGFAEAENPAPPEAREDELDGNSFDPATDFESGFVGSPTVDVEGQLGGVGDDPTLHHNDEDSAGIGDSGGQRGSLDSLRDQLEAELEAVRSEREGVLRRAEALEDLERVAP